MNINQFIEEYKASANKEKYAEKHITKHYLPFEIKTGLAQKIIESSMYTIIQDKKIFKPDTPTRYMCFVMAIIQNYTDLEFSDSLDNEHSVGQQNLNSFNLLEENDAIEIIMKAIGADIKRFNTVLQMTMDDVIDQERHLIPYLDTKIDAWQIALSTIGNVLEERMKELGDV